uniref:DSBA oxidoreductase n=1 Tax=Thermosporothrix sp. COM3 TaxID=2490863 RepID=A0A455SFW7_9CHLR|nr:DSBA oxidoreductase [Thermosporothrix sp. COM3]
MKIEIFSDILCPWCYIGKQRLRSALARFPYRDQVEISFSSFELDPSLPADSQETIEERTARSTGRSPQEVSAMLTYVTELARQEGLNYHLEGVRLVNSRSAHRLVHLASRQKKQEAMQDRLWTAFLSEHRSISDPTTLLELAVEVGLDPDEVQAVLDSDAYMDEVNADKQRALLLGITGVPFFVIDEKYGISGAQTSEVFLKVLETAWAETHPSTGLELASEAEGTCEGGSCPL